MLKTNNLLASLSLEIPALEANSEGQLRGGFSAFGAGINPMAANTGCKNEGCSNQNCDCNCSCNSNNNCNCNCGGCQTNGKCGGDNKTTPAEGDAKVSSFNASFLF